MTGSVKLSTVTNEDFARVPAWQVGGDVLEDEDPELVPAARSDDGKLSRSIGEVWCLADAIFSDGSRLPSIALCRGDSSDGPMLWQVWDGRQYIPLVVPPAPDFVLDVDGPIPFSGKFGRTVEAEPALTMQIWATILAL